MWLFAEMMNRRIIMVKIITISREFGSGGRTIGKDVADRLGIPCYDKELIEKISNETGYGEVACCVAHLFGKGLAGEQLTYFVVCLQIGYGVGAR